MKPPTTPILLAYLNAVQRLQRAIAAADTDPDVDAWLAGLLAIDETYAHMTEIPYGILDNQMNSLGIGRQIWRLAHAVQLLAEWRFVPGTAATHHDVVVAFNEIGEERFGRDTIFPGVKVSPAAQRAILAMPFFANGMRGWIVEGIGTESSNMVTITGSMGVTAEFIPPNVRLNPATKVWDVVPN